MNCKKWTESSGNLRQRIENCTQEVMLYGCMFLGKIVGELTRCENCMSKENGLNLYVKNNIEPLEPLLVAARTS